MGEPWLTDILDYTLNNPDTLTKYKTAAQISHKVLEAVSGVCACLANKACLYTRSMSIVDWR